MAEQNINPEMHKIESEYRREVAIVKARPILHQVGFIAWTVLDVILVLLFIVYIASYLVAGSFSERAEVASIADNIGIMHDVVTGRSAEALSVGNVDVFSLGDENYDFYVELENPNADWYAEFDYYFEYGEETSDRLQGFIMPGERKPFVALRQPFATRPSNAELVVDEFEWSRVDAHAVEDVDWWVEEHMNFEVAGEDYSEIKIDGEDIGRSSFSVTNATPYSYWSPVFIVVLERNNNVIGVNQATVAGFESGETRDVTVNWFGDSPSSAEVVVLPNINFFDEDAYMAPPGESGSDIRDEF
ncbi:MAG: hypothetical protein ABIA47_00095 [bacterium]